VHGPPEVRNLQLTLLAPASESVILSASQTGLFVECGEGHGYLVSNQNVLRLDVPVNHVLRVAVAEGAGQLGDVLHIHTNQLLRIGIICDRSRNPGNVHELSAPHQTGHASEVHGTIHPQVRTPE
jgi:hypothetical protein